MTTWKLLSQEEVTSQNLFSILLKNTNIGKKDEESFLHPTLESITFQTTGIDKKEADIAVVRIKKAIKNRESIVVYTDYDADGVSGGAILWETLYKLGGHVMPYVPHRVREGYGLSKLGIENIKKEFNPALLITVDHGITSGEKVEYAKHLGMDVIILDHHLIPKNPPKPFALVHTTGLSASGIFWLFSNYLRSVVKEISFEELKKNYLDLAVIGTVADLVPLTGPNRAIVKCGLERLNNTKRLGLLALIEQSGLKDKEIDTYHIGHIIAPRINAMGRITHAMDALRLLCTTDGKRARELARILGYTNTNRQDLTRESTDIAFEMVKKDESILIISHEEFNEGIIGLVAGKLTEKYNKPSVVMSLGKEFAKASARSVAGFNIVEFFREEIGWFVDVGGHPMAAGFTVKLENVEKLQEVLEKKAKKILKGRKMEKEIPVDAQLPLSALDTKLLKTVELLKPFGVANPEPVFLSKNAEIVEKRFVGKTGSHLKIKIKDSKNNTYYEAMGFGMGERVSEFIENNHLDIVYRVCENEWNGEKKLQL